MSLKMKSRKVSGNREERMSPFHTPKRNKSPKNWSPPQQKRESGDRSASPNTQSPQHYNSCTSPNGSCEYPRYGSPNQWDSASDDSRSSPYILRSPCLSPIYRLSPEHGYEYSEESIQEPENTSDIYDYYSPSMLEDPWKGLEAKPTESAVSTESQEQCLPKVKHLKGQLTASSLPLSSIKAL